MNLAKLMKDRGLNQVELAKKSGISQPLISNYLIQSPRGKQPTLRNLLALQRALGCTLEELTGIPALQGIEEKIAKHRPTPEAIAFAEALEKLSPDDPRRRAIELLLMDMKPETPADPAKSEPDVK